MFSKRLEQNRPSSLLSMLVCPCCHSHLTAIGKGAKCPVCLAVYPLSQYGTLDMRLKKPIKTHTVHVIGQPTLPITLTYSKLTLRDLIPFAETKDAPMLDLGCGNTRHKALCTSKNYRYIGLDYDSAEADVLGDAHALPFEDKTFDLIFSRSVIEHLRHPLVAMREAYRVLKPHGVLVGSAAFLEPFHGDSYTHNTHLGLISLFQDAGFTVDILAPNTAEDWHVLKAQAAMSLFPGMPTMLSQALVTPLNMAHKTWWKIASALRPDKLNEQKRLLWTAGSFLFKLHRA